METLFSILEMAVDFVLLLPPISQIQEWKIPPYIPELVCFGALVVLFVAITYESLRRSSLFGNNPIAVFLAAVCVAGLAFTGMGFGVWHAIFSTSYIAMVLAIRSAEGAGIGVLFAQKPAWTLSLFFALVLGIATFLVLASFPPHTVAIVKIIWAVVAATVGSLGATWKVTRGLTPPGQSPALIGFAIFIVFLSSTLYIAGLPALVLLYAISLPIGIVVGMGATLLERRRHTIDNVS